MSAAAPLFVEGRDYAVLERWQPHPASQPPTATALGLRLVPTQTSHAALKALVRELRKGHDPFVIEAFASERAYKTCAHHEREWTVPLCKREFLLVSDGQTITWMGPHRSREQTPAD